jgi:zinc protease
MTTEFSALLGLTRQLLLSAMVCFSAGAAAQEPELIPFKAFTLDNGLTLIVHEDKKAPIVAVNVWYHVGSRNERPGQTGYAHLFEHLMFQGSENAPGDYINIVNEMGATGLNGTTSFDRTNYFQTVPVGALDRLLFLESDRMGHMLGAVDQAVLDEQRAVVQNEKRQGDNRPYASVWQNILEQVFPPGHPYSWSVIGSMEDLEAASLEEMHEWFNTYYGPDNSVLVVAGDVDANQVLAKVDHYFGDIPAGPPLTVQKEWIPRHTAERRMTVQDRVPQERLYLAWTAPRWGTIASRHMELATDVLGQGKNSRLYKRLVYQDQLASDVSMFVYSLEISGLTILQISVAEGADIDEVERIVKEELELFIGKGPTRTELERVQTANRASFLRGLEKVGGFGGSKSSVLAEFAVYGGEPAGYRQYLKDIASAKREHLREVADQWLGQQAPFIAQYLPFPERPQNNEGADRSTLPGQDSPETAEFPPFSRDFLSNGLEVVLIERPDVPLLNLSLVVAAGYADDEESSDAMLAMAMLEEGTERRDALEISSELALQGATLSSRASLDGSTITMSALTDNTEESLALFADLILNPTFPAAELPRVKSEHIAAIRQEANQPLNMALRVLPSLLYGEKHPYAKPLTGTGTEASVTAATQSSIAQWHQTWFRPNNARLIIVGDTSKEEILPKLEALFGNWPAAEIPRRSVVITEAPAQTALYLIDKPGAVQSVIVAGELITPLNNPQEAAIEAMDDILGGQFAARINMNLREDKGWSYGARSLVKNTAGQRPWLVYAPVQSDKTAAALAEINREISEFVSANPATAEELERIQRTNILSLAGRWETGPAVLKDLTSLLVNALGDDYWNNYAKRLEALNLEQVVSASRSTLRPNQLTWVVIGDRAKIEADLEKLGIAKITLLDAQGND